jgi:hypothetical protein
MSWHQAVPAFGRDPLEPADRLDRLGGIHSNGATDGQFVLDVLGQVGGVEGEDETAAAHRIVEPHHKALVPGSVSGLGHDADRDGEQKQLQVLARLAQVRRP